VSARELGIPTTSVNIESVQSASLLEKHLEKQRKNEKKGKKAEAGTARHTGADWDRTVHPWRPFDRDQDLEIKPAGGRIDPKDLLKGTQGLSSRFARGS
jgi:hypothetical protein